MIRISNCSLLTATALAAAALATSSLSTLATTGTTTTLPLAASLAALATTPCTTPALSAALANALLSTLTRTTRSPAAPLTGSTRASPQTPTWDARRRTDWGCRQTAVRLKTFQGLAHTSLSAKDNAHIATLQHGFRLGSNPTRQNNGRSGIRYALCGLDTSPLRLGRVVSVVQPLKLVTFRIIEHKSRSPTKTRVHGIVQSRALAADGDNHSHLLVWS